MAWIWLIQYCIWLLLFSLKQTFWQNSFLARKLCGGGRKTRMRGREKARVFLWIYSFSSTGIWVTRSNMSFGSFYVTGGFTGLIRWFYQTFLYKFKHSINNALCIITPSDSNTILQFNLTLQALCSIERELNADISTNFKSTVYYTTSW